MENEKLNFKDIFKKRLYTFTLNLIKIIDSLPKDSVSGVMGKQLLRSSTSIIANYVEGGSASSRKDLINFLTYSLKSANESKVWIALLRDTKRVKGSDVEKILDELIQISKIIASSIIKLKGKK